MDLRGARGQRSHQILISDAGRERLAQWLFVQMSPLRGVHWMHLGTTERLWWLDHADDAIWILDDGLPRMDPSAG